jgi:hypothetical protein
VKPEIFEIIKEGLSNPEKLQELLLQTEQVLAARGLRDSADVATVRQVLGLIGMAGAAANRGGPPAHPMPDQLATTNQTADSFKRALQKTLDQIDDGFRSTMLMYKVAFYLGVGLLVAAAFLAAFTDKSLIAGVFAGLGTADVLTFFLTQPPAKLQSSRAQLAQLQAAYFNWFIDLSNWNSYLLTLNGTNQATFENVNAVSAAVYRSTEQTLALVEKFVSLEDAEMEKH